MSRFSTLMAMPASARKNMSLPLTATGSKIRCTASATRTPVTAQLHRTEASAARTSTRWYLCKETADEAVWHCPGADLHYGLASTRMHNKLK